MLNKLIGSMVALAFIAGCGLDPAEDQAARAEAEALAQEATNPALREIKAGAQTKKETGIVTWKIFKEKNNFRVVGYDKKNKRLFTNRTYSLNYPWTDPGVAMFMSRPAIVAGTAEAAIGYNVDLEHGYFMRPETRDKVNAILRGLSRDFSKEATRVGCIGDSLVCTASTAACIYSAFNTTVCLNAAWDCSNAFNSCGTTQMIKDVAEWTGESLNQHREACEEIPGICLGT